jgi:hypothetical protein
MGIEKVSPENPWTAADEANFRNLSNRRQKILEDREARLMAALSGMELPQHHRESVADYLVRHAGAVCSALEPYANFPKEPA